MKLETMKSLILVILIGISIILSYTLWSYQPSTSQTISRDIAGDEMNAGGSNEESRRSLIKPSKIIFHTDNQVYGFHNAKEQDELFKEMQEEWVITNFEVNENEALIENMDEGLELIFPEEIPMRAIESLLTFGSDEIHLPNWTMKRVFINFIHDSKSLQVQFQSEETDDYATALINDASIYEKLYQNVAILDEEQLREYLVVDEAEEPIYFPSGEVELATYSITPSEIDDSLFVNILFTNPSVVRETNSQTIGKTYYTDNRQLSIYQNGMRMEYVSHATSDSEEQEDRDLTEIDIIDRSITNINNHSGWTYEARFNQEYRLEDINTDRNEITYQMYYKGYPVFNNYKLAVIQQRWEVYQNTEQLIEYDRPLYLFEGEFLLREADDLPTGESVLEFLKTDPSVSIENLQDVTIGYELHYEQQDQESDYIEMQPAWYKQENDTWQKIVFDEEHIYRGGN